MATGDIADLCAHFDAAGLMDPVHRLPAVGGYRVDAIADGTAAAGDPARGADLVPALLRTYLKAGARVCSQPAVDRKFRCTDWLTVLDMRRMTATFDRKFRRTEPTLDATA